ncbi:MAG: T9SS type A sorting domain-containing protein [Bacteroidota bacterium]|nr:T9SS type A sorting domain-containing protein [Bacteroidota bacterium]
MSLLLALLVSSTSYAGVIYSGGPGTGAPPATLGGLPMYAFPADSRPLFQDESFVYASSYCDAIVVFSTPLNHRRIGTGWASWSHGYTGDVYFEPGTTVTLTLPPNVRAIYFYAEPNVFASFNVIATANDGTNSGLISVSGSAGAKYFGFYTNSQACLLTSITISVDPAAAGFAIGEFGINMDINNGAIACNDDVQISLDQFCTATITPDMILEGEGDNASCPGDFVVTVRDWITNKIIDADPVAFGAQIGRAQIGRHLKITVTDPATGNSCWGKAYIEDKLPPILDCPDSITISCLDDSSPAFTGEPTVTEFCGPFTLVYKDVVRKGSCVLLYDKIIIRTWTATDSVGNKSTCSQVITVLLGTLEDVRDLPHYDITDGSEQEGHEPALRCDEKYNPNFNLSQHLRPAPVCVDDYLLDQELFEQTQQRLPRTLGWNCIDYAPYFGHPNPKPIYYPKHTGCWDDKEIIMWLGTGEPTAAGCNNLAMTFRDIRIDISKPGCNAGPVGCYKILRTWTILDWCTGEIEERIQIIKVIDYEGPKILYPDVLVVSTDPWKCEGRWDVPPAWVTDNCSEEIHYTVKVDDGTVLGSEISGYVVVNLPLGIQNAYIVAEDCCGNVTEKQLIIDVQDNNPPVAVCDQKTVITITGNLSPGQNFAKLNVISLDDGSFDNCAQHLFFKGIRMDELNGTAHGSTKSSTVCGGGNGDDDLSIVGSQTYFDDNIKFCCEDAGKTLMVVLRVFDVDPGVGPVTPARMDTGDLKGHFSDCMVEVEVQDKSVPTVVAPPDIVVSCMFWFDLDAIKDPNDSTFGKIVNDLAWRAKVKTRDIVCEEYCLPNLLTGYPGFIGGIPPHLQPAPNKACEFYRSLFSPAHPDNKYDLVWGFDGYILSTCGALPTITITDLRECGSGRIVRNIIARGPNNTIVRATQTIWIVDCDPFYINPKDPCDPDDDITWPDCQGNGTIVRGCGGDVDPDVIGRPRIENNADDNCALIAIAHFDEIFTIEPDACFKILRRWVVIDWCQYDPNLTGNNGRWEFTQVIKVRDDVKPVVTCNVGPCEPAVVDTRLGYCLGHISLTVTATDSCSPSDWLFYEYKLDLFNNGTYDFGVGTLTRREYALGVKPSISNNPYADNDENPFDASGVYPIGIHKIKWFVEDGCGNIGICETLFEIKDCKAPTPYCLTGIITVPMPSTGCVTIWARDLDAQSNDNCTPRNKLKFYFNGDTAKQGLTVCCSDFIANKVNDELTLTVQVWVEDQEGNRDYCVTTIIVQDNQDICPNSSTSLGRLNGELKTENGDLTALSSVDLYSNGQLLRTMTTNGSGYYSFGDIELNKTYTIKPSRFDNSLNGVTTADIVKLQKHILGVEDLNSPYKILAADVNLSKSVTAADISEIRKLILGIILEFNYCPSWMFIPSDLQFADPTKPWNYVNEKSILLTGPQIENFVAVKMGDLNNSAAANFNNNVQSRTNGSLNFEIEKAKLVAGDEYKMSVRASDFTNIAGYQFTLKFDQAALSFDRLEKGILAISENNFGMNYLAEGMLTTSWSSEKPVTYGSNEVLFTLVFKVNRNVNLEGSVAITSDVTAAEAYDQDLNAKNIRLNVRSDKGLLETGVFELYQNTPNPFNKTTDITFRLPEAGKAKLTIYDMTGKVLHVKELKGQKGINQVSVKRDEIHGTGMFYYQLDADNHTASKRMIILE